MSLDAAFVLSSVLQLASPSLPVGAFSYSQGLEAAIEAGWVHDAATAHHWIRAGLDIQAEGDAVLLVHAYRGWQAPDWCLLQQVNDLALAVRESAELRLESEQMGGSLLRLLRELLPDDPVLPDVAARWPRLALPVAQALAAHRFQVPLPECLVATLFGWVENQVAAAIKAVPLGQAAGQRILFALRPDVAAAAVGAQGRQLSELNTFAPLLGIFSARHEQQYSRLFRS